MMEMQPDQIGIADMNRVRTGMQLEEVEQMQPLTVQGFMSQPGSDGADDHFDDSHD